jgi:hypothetical protein
MQLLIANYSAADYALLQYHTEAAAATTASWPYIVHHHFMQHMRNCYCAQHAPSCDLKEFCSFTAAPGPPLPAHTTHDWGCHCLLWSRTGSGAGCSLLLPLQETPPTGRPARLPQTYHCAGRCLGPVLEQARTCRFSHMHCVDHY